MIRFARALMQALRLTLRGESLTPAHYRPLEAWIRDGLTLLDKAERAAAADRIDLAALRLKLDGRPTSLGTTLKMLRHNLTEAYPRLIRLDDPHSMTVVQSSNLNDQYRVGQFAASDVISSAALRRALEGLDAHLQNLPEVDLPQSGT
ncbi:MAG: hypothetical protein OXG68_16960 [Chloroflexi bacterium]|nr:hypothetical protein [Chloroflexota bacterium]